MNSPILEAHGLVKRFGPVMALDGADLNLYPGIHALLGENGAGKSTLVKCIYGYYRPDAGQVLLNGRPVEIRSPADARRLGIGLVFQQFTLIPALTVAENIALFLPDLPAILDRRELDRKIRETSERYGLAVDPTPRVGMLSLPEQQRVEIVRVLLAGARVLIFDEPTSSLPAQEIDALFAVFRRLHEDGYPVVVITHKMPEVFAVADTVTVMRRGTVVATLPIGEVDERRLVQLMFGEEPPAVERGVPLPQSGPPLLALERVTAVGEGRPLVDLDLEIRPGEIVGVAGIAGNGQHELGDAVVGVSRLSHGRRRLFGQDATHWSVRRIRDAGVGFVPESALGQSLIWSMTLEENILLGARRYTRAGGLSLDRRAARNDLEHRYEALGLNLPSGNLRAGTLSGGNAQRFAIARQLAEQPRLLVLLYPTHGLDVPTAATVQRLLLDARDQGTGILLVSQDLQELRTLSNRLLVMREGRIVAQLSPGTDAYEIGRLMTGGEPSPTEALEPPVRGAVSV